MEPLNSFHTVRLPSDTAFCRRVNGIEMLNDDGESSPNIKVHVKMRQQIVHMISLSSSAKQNGKRIWSTGD